MTEKILVRNDYKLSGGDGGKFRLILGLFGFDKLNLVRLACSKARLNLPIILIANKQNALVAA